MAQEVRSRVYTSIDTFIKFEGDEGSKKTYGNLLGVEDKNFAAMEHKEELKERLKNLPPKERRILTEISKGRSMTEISRDYKCSRERIRQLKVEAIRKVRKLPDLPRKGR